MLGPKILRDISFVVATRCSDREMVTAEFCSSSTSVGGECGLGKVRSVRSYGSISCPARRGLLQAGPVQKHHAPPLDGSIARLSEDILTRLKVSTSSAKGLPTAQHMLLLKLVHALHLDKEKDHQQSRRSRQPTNDSTYWLAGGRGSVGCNSESTPVISSSCLTLDRYDSYSTFSFCATVQKRPRKHMKRIQGEGTPPPPPPATGSPRSPRAYTRPTHLQVGELAKATPEERRVGRVSHPTHHAFHAQV